MGKSVQKKGENLMICCVCYDFPPMTGGSETHTYSEVKYLSDEGHNVCVVVLRSPKARLYQTGYDEEMVERSHCKVITLPGIENVPVFNIERAGLLRDTINIRKVVSRFENGGKVDIFDVHNVMLVPSLIGYPGSTVVSLHMHDFMCPGIFHDATCPAIGWSDKSFSLKKCVLSERCVSSKDYLYWRLNRQYALHKVDKIIVKKKAMKALMVRNGVDEDKIAFIPHWVDIDAIHSGCASGIPKNGIKGLDDQDFVFLSLGRLSRVKRPRLLLDAFKRVASQASHAKMVLLGQGDLDEEIRKRVRSYGLSKKVIMLGRIANDLVPRYLSIADTIVHTQRYSNYGWALLETMAAKKPIVATNAGDTHDILVDGFNALLAEPNAESLAERMLESMHDKFLTEKLRRNAYRTVVKRHSRRNLQKLEALLTRLN